MDSNRSWSNKQDVEEILDIIDYSLYSSKAVNRNFFLWYMTKKGKLHVLFEVDSEIETTLNKMDTLVETIKAFNALDMNADSKKKDHIISIVSIARDDIKNLSYRFEGYHRVFIGFMYGYYLKAGIVSAMDVIQLEDEAPNIKGIPSYAITIASILKTIDGNGYLDRKKYPKVECNFTPVVGSDPTSVKSVATVTSTDTSDKPTIIDMQEVKQNKEPEKVEYINQFVVIKGGKFNRIGKEDITLDMLEIYNSYKDGLFNYNELAELYGVSNYTVIMKLRKFCEENNLPLKTNNMKSAKKEADKTQNEEEEDALFEKAQAANVSQINKMKRSYHAYPSSENVVIVTERNFQNKPVTFSSKIVKGSRTKLVISDDIKKQISEKGSGYYKLNDGSHYYVTSDYLIFRNEPTEETLEKYRSVKSFG